MKRTIRNRTVRILLLVGFGLTILLLTIRHYYEATTFNTLLAANQSVIQTIAVLNNTIELTGELIYAPYNQLTDSTTWAIYKNNRAARNTAAIRPLLDSLVSLTIQTPGLNPLARRLQAEAETALRGGINESERSRMRIDQLLRSIRTFRLALADSLSDNEKQIRDRIATMRTLGNLIDSLVLILASALLYFFYRYTLRRERLTGKVLERQKELTQYLEAIPEGVVVVNTARQIVYVNQVGHRLLNTSPTATPIAFSDWAAQFRMSRADSKTSFQLADLPLSRALQDEAVSTDTLRLETEGGFRLLATHTHPLYSREEELVGAITIFRDITEASRKEEELKQARLIAEQSLQEREIFLANISHDIRTPLNVILGFTEILRQNRSTPEEQGYLDGIRLSGNNLLALINELLDLSKMESGQLILEPVPTVPDEIIRVVEANLALKAGEKGLRYQVWSDPAVPQVLLADPVRLTQILLNFCSNAVNSTKEGFIHLRVQAEKSDQPDHVNVTFTIEDSGVGIAPENLDRVFTRFSRVSEDTLFRSAGTGLGLNIAQSLVTLMQGTVAIQSRLGQGTTFTVRIPFAIPTVVVASVPASPIPAQPAPRTDSTADRPTIAVLIVEDNEMNQRVLQGFLMRHQLKPTIANNGLEAVAILEKKAFDLILMDIQMPEMDGYTATQTIRQRLALTTPIVAMTAYTMTGERERCLAMGMNEYLSKPVRIEQIDEILTRFAPGLRLNAIPLMGANDVETREELIDQAYLEEVTVGDSELLDELIALFVAELPNYRQALFQSVADKDRLTFSQVTHKFQSSLNSLAMLGIAKRLRKMGSEDQAFDVDLGVRLANLFQDINRGLTILESRAKRNMSN